MTNPKAKGQRHGDLARPGFARAGFLERLSQGGQSCRLDSLFEQGEDRAFCVAKVLDGGVHRGPEQAPGLRAIARSVHLINTIRTPHKAGEDLPERGAAAGRAALA